MGKVRTSDVTGFSYHYPRNTAVVSVKSGDKENCLAVAWHSSLSQSPPMYGVSIAPKRYSYGLIEKAGEFAVNFIPFSEVKTVAFVGGRSGRDMDKFAKFNLGKDDPLVINSPILSDAYAAYECKLAGKEEYGDHGWFVGEVVAVHYDEEAFDKTFQMKKVKPVLYLGRDIYAQASSPKIYHISRKRLDIEKL